MKRAGLRASTDYAVARLLGKRELQRLAAEAFECASRAGVSFSDAVLREGQEGVALHWLETANGGPSLEAFLGSERTLRSLERLTGRCWQRRSKYCNYSYYRQPHHFNGLHRDVGACELSVVTCIHDEPGEGGDLILFPSRASETLDAIRASPEVGAVALRLQPGESLVMYGKVVPHCLTPVGIGRTRISAPACYRAA